MPAKKQKKKRVKTRKRVSHRFQRIIISRRSDHYGIWTRWTLILTHLVSSKLWMILASA